MPLVLGPSAVPLVTDPERARRSPELALLSVQAHGQSEAALAVGQAAASATAELDRETAMLYFTLIQMAVHETARYRLEETMRVNLEELRKAAEQRLGEIIRAEVKAKAKTEALAEALVKVLTSRGLPVTDRQRAKILSCVDPGVMDSWLERSVHVATVEELFLQG